MVRKAIVLGSNGPPWQELQFAETDADRMEVTLNTRCDFEVERLPSDLDYHEIQNASRMQQPHVLLAIP
jgi:hypothetical protein